MKIRHLCSSGQYAILKCANCIITVHITIYAHFHHILILGLFNIQLQIENDQ